MPALFQHVLLTDIASHDLSFIVTYRPDLQALERSVARTGVLTPLHLRRKPESRHLQLVCGSKRLQACLQTGRTRLPALVHDAADLSEEQAFRLAVHDNLGCRRLNLIEKGRILQRLRERFHYATEVLVQEWCPLLELPPRRVTVDRYCALVMLDDALQTAAMEETLSLETALWIGRQAPADREALLALFTGLKIGRNRAREIATWVDELCHRDDCGAATVLRKEGVPAILADSELTGPQKLERVRQALHKARYPLLSAHAERFRDTLRRLRLPSQVKLHPPPYFEGQQFHVTFDFGSRQELQQVLRRLSETAASEAIDDLLELL